jgi:hypothetical protein
MCMKCIKIFHFSHKLRDATFFDSSLRRESTDIRAVSSSTKSVSFCTHRVCWGVGKSNLAGDVKNSSAPRTASSVTFTSAHGLTYLLTYLLTYGAEPFFRSRQLCSHSWNFPAFYGTRKLITALQEHIHWSLSWARSFQSIPPLPF